MAQKKTVLACFLISTVCYGEEYISAPLHVADWKLNKGPATCQLTQDIPFFGTAKFTHHSGEKLQFSVIEQRFKPEIVKASLTVDSAPWIHHTMPHKDYVVMLDQQNQSEHYPALTVQGDTAEKMLDVLLKGYFPVFSYIRASTVGLLPQTNVAISSVNFNKTYQLFGDCRKNFLPDGFKEVLEKSLFFKPRSQQLTDTIQQQLINTAQYIKQVTGSRVRIISDTASAGSRDKVWFLKRANSIAAQLKKLGVADKKITIKSGSHRGSSSHKVVQLKVFGPDALRTIYYRKGNTALTEQEKRRLDLLLKYHDEYLPNSRLVINSHTDSKGKRANNLKVSQRRGDTIKQYLISKGLPENKIQVKAYGESRPVKSNRFPNGRSQNRRVNIDFVG